ncbi:KipI antagonist [Botrimarina mediterranea]|uniref:KipI antagonist n=1 Tax=Botrimarina mediterranea TaxID=2528022 RepID=A0A518KBW1_9BACT|nr:KipI antagonist [Botrimarina mediterranea]
MSSNGYRPILAISSRQSPANIIYDRQVRLSSILNSYRHGHQGSIILSSLLGDTAVLLNGVLENDAHRGVLDIVPAFDATAVHFDPTQFSIGELTAWIDSNATKSNHTSVASRLIEIPVRYGDEFGPDLDTVAKHAGLTADEVVRRHAAVKYVVGAVGFQPGFGYLEGLPAELHTPRHSTPRTAVPVGAVGIGGPYTAVYPSASPGGWNLIGQTPLVMFEEGRTEPSLLKHGDRVRFRAINAKEFKRLAAVNHLTPSIEPPPERPLLRVVNAGAQSTLQGLPRYGRQHLGVSPGGAMDTMSLRLANLLAGNAPGATAIEATLMGPVLEAIEPVTLALAGAVPTARCVTLRAGEQLDLRRLTGGARAYIAIPGGFGGSIGRTLGVDDVLGSLTNPTHQPSTAVLAGAGRRRSPTKDVTTLHLLRGPQAPLFDDEAWRRLLNETYRVAPQSSRMGVRLEGPELPVNGAVEMPSQPVCTGAVQVPPDGQPIALGADRQTLGGYPVIAAIISADWSMIGQLAPGNTVRFAEVNLEEAIRLRKKLERDLALAAVGIQLEDQQF